MTQEFVTLPRAVVEQAIDALYCTDSEEGSPAYNFELKAIKELRAALEQPDTGIPTSVQPQEDQEPVATVNRLGAIYLTQAGCGMQPGTRLYTHPQPNREPLTDEQIAEVLIDETNGRSTGIGFKTLRAFARAIERAHNIK